MPTPYEVIQEYKGKEQIVVWFGEKASYEDKVVWRSVRKVWFLSETEETPMLEIKTAEDLALYESALRQQGWIPDEKYNLGTISRATFWKKADYAG